MKRIFGIILILIIMLFAKEEKIKLEKDEYIGGFYAVVYKIKGDTIDLGENGTIIAQKGIEGLLEDTLGNKISLSNIEFPALFEIKAITKGISEIIPEIVKSIKRVLSLKYIGGKEKAEEYLKYLKEIEKQFEK